MTVVTPTPIDRMMQAIVDEVDSEKVTLPGSSGRGHHGGDSNEHLIAVETEPFRSQPEPMPRRRAWLLLSGGIDSAACLAFCLKKGLQVHCLHISFGQPASRQERMAAERVAGHFGVPLTHLRWFGTSEYDVGEITGRNAFLLLAALTEIGADAGILAIGIHDGTPYYDCSSAFLSSMQVVFDGYCDGRVRLSAPFVDWSKSQVLAFCRAQEVPVHLTYSCERGTAHHCGDCMSCRDRRIMHVV